MSLIRHVTIVAGLAITISACASQNTVLTYANHYPFYEPSLVASVAANGEFPVYIAANPFGAESDERHLAALALPGGYPRAKLTRIARDNERTRGHLVFVFNPADANVSGATICKAPDQVKTAAQGQRITVQTAFCFNDEVVSEVRMQTNAPKSVTDRNFLNAMHDALAILLMEKSPNKGDCGDRASC